MAGEVIRVVVADDQTVVREGIAMLLGLLPGLDVVGAAADGEEAVRLVAETAPDVVLMDLRMPRCDGVEATRVIRCEHPGTQVVILTTFGDDDSLFAALGAGARGFLTKDAGSDEILRALEDVTRGEAGLSPQVQRRLLERLSQSDPPGSAWGPPAASGSPSRGASGAAERRGGPSPAGAGSGSSELPDGLTVREAEVLGLVGDGMSNAEIAAELFVSAATVKTHINNIFAKTGVRDRAQAVRYAFRHRIVRDRESG